MLYFDSLRLRAFNDSLDPVLRRKAHELRSPNLLLRNSVFLFHSNLYRDLLRLPKSERRHLFLKACGELQELPEHRQALGLLILRTALLEGSLGNPFGTSLDGWFAFSFFQYFREEDTFKIFLDTVFGPLIKHLCKEDDEDTDSFFTMRRLALRESLAGARNMLYLFLTITPVDLETTADQTWWPRYHLWFCLVLYDAQESQHLAALDSAEFLQTDYWQCVCHYRKDLSRHRCHGCGRRSSSLEVVPLKEGIRGQEILFPEFLNCFCPDCLRQPADQS